MPPPRQNAANWWRNLLSHPDITAMDERQRADLPMPQLPVPMEDRCLAAQKNGASRGGNGATSMASNGKPEQACSAICS